MPKSRALSNGGYRTVTQTTLDQALAKMKGKATLKNGWHGNAFVMDGKAWVVIVSKTRNTLGDFPVGFGVVSLDEVKDGDEDEAEK